MTRWHDRFVGAWLGMLTGTVAFVTFQLLTSAGIRHVLSLRELVSMSALWIISGAVIGLPFLVVAAILNRVAKAKRALPSP